MIPPVLTSADLAALCGVKETSNLVSVQEGLAHYGESAGLGYVHRLVPYLCQITHESQDFRYDRELWGPTAAQKRYDIRTDLGNTPERDGDGKKYAGHTAMQITGKHNTREFRDWCRAWVDPKCPDFVAHPELMNTDPWEGLGPIWYWNTRGLNRWADAGDQEKITKLINGGYNGHLDRLIRYSNIGLTALGYQTTIGGVRKFQMDAGLTPDGISGPKTRLSLHKSLRLAPPVRFAGKTRKVAPPKASSKTQTPQALVGVALAILTALFLFLKGSN